MSFYHYFAYGLHIRSEIHCSSLAEYIPKPGAEPDTNIRFGTTPDTLEQPIAHGVLYSASMSKYLLQIPEVANYLVQDATEIIVERSSRCSESEIALFLLASPLAALLHQRGNFVLHASVVQTKAGAVAFVGSSGVGKSTLAIALAAKGCRVLTDELCVLDTDSNNIPYIWPGAADSMLWRDSIKMLGSDTEHLAKVRPGLEKYAFRMSSDTDYENPIALRRIYILSVTNTPMISINTIRGSRKVQILLQHQFNEKLVSDLRMKHSALGPAAKLLAGAEMHNVYHPRSSKSLATTVEKISLDFKTIHMPCPTVVRNRSHEVPEKTTSSSTDTPAPPELARTKSKQPACSASEKKDNIIWMASYPKSGNTWLRAFLANYISTCEDPININNLAKDRATGLLASQRKIFDNFTGTKASNFTNDEIDSLRPLVYEQISAEHAKHSIDSLFIKIHDALTFSRSNQRSLIPETSTRAVIYVVRNPLDVAISYAHHFDMSIDESIQTLNNENQRISESRHGLTAQLQQVLTSWSGHYWSWVTNQQKPILVVRFEDMQEKPHETFKNIIEFSGMELNASNLEKAVQSSNFNVLRKQESAARFGENPSTSAFFRQGVSGGWKDILSQPQVDLLTAKHGKLMRKLNYC